jgi:hypothetical protein
MVRVLAVFHGQGDHPLGRWLKPDFRHVFVACRTEPDGDPGQSCWFRIDWQTGNVCVEHVAGGAFDLAAFYRSHGYTVIEAEARDGRGWWPLEAITCVGLAKMVLGIRAAFVLTPWQLYRHLRKDE